MPSPLRLAHITDLHARQAIYGWCSHPKRRSRDMFDLLRETITHAKQNGADFLALTGDLLDVPGVLIDSSDYYPFDRDAWHDVCVEDYRTLKTLLDQSGLAYTVLPGNHDVERYMWQAFDPTPTTIDLPQGYRVLRFYDREWDGHVPRRLDRERKLWQAALTQTDGPPQIHLQHYLITPHLTPTAKYPYSYEESEELLAKLSVDTSPVSLCLSGHYHAGSPLIRENNCFFSTTPAFAEYPHPYRLYDIQNGHVDMQTINMRDAPRTAGKPVVFLDRDGVINQQDRYSTGPQALTLIDGVAQAIARLHEAGYIVVVITNQSNVGAGHVLRRTVHTVHERLYQLLWAQHPHPESYPDAIYYSAGDKHAVLPRWSDTGDAKPNTVLLERAIDELGLDRHRAWLIGDRATDMQCAQNFGAKAILVRTGRGAPTEAQASPQDKHDWLIADHLPDAVNQVIQNV